MLLMQEDMAMNTFDFSPLFRSTIGFDRLMQLAETATRLDPGYPPYNIEVTGDDSYRLTMAVAGFSAGELDITVKENTLEIAGRAKTDKEPQRVLYRGIARRAFERRFELADHIKVAGAKLENGLLSLDLVREVPEALKPRKIAIGGAEQSKTLEQKAA
jgi:molecular chaperone IbpA